MIFTLLSIIIAQAPTRSTELELYRAQLAAAESAERLGEFAVARGWLEETDPALRGFEWRVHDAALDESLTSFSTGTAHAYSIAASPNGTTLALGFTDGRIEVREARGGALIAEVGRHTEGLSDLAYSADGRRLVSASFDRTVRVWDVEKRRQTLEFKGHGFPVGGASFSPDGKLVASCSYERPPGTVVGTVHVWNPDDGTIVRTMNGGRKPLVGLAFSPDGRFVAAGSWDFCVFVWSVDGGEPVKCAVPDEGIYNAVDDVAWTANGEFVVGASKDKTARVWNAKSGELVASLRGHTDYVVALAASPDGTLLATGSGDGTTKLWNAADWTLRSTLRGHADDVVACAFSADGLWLHTSSNDKTVRSWDAKSNRYGGARWNTSAAPYVARFSPNDELVATASFDGRIEIREVATLEVVRSIDAHPSNKSCHGLAWTPDGRRLVSGSWEPLVKVWEVETGGQVGEFEQKEGTSYLAVSPDGRLVASCSGKEVLLFDLADTSRRSEFLGHTSTVLGAAFSPDSKRCVSTGRDGRAIVWSVEDRTMVWDAKPGNADVAEAMFTPDGSRVVVAGRSGLVTLHEAADGKLVRELASLRHGIDHIDVTPDGTRVVLASNVVSIVDIANGRVVGEIRPHVEQPYNIDFDSRGERLISCSTDKTVVIVDTVPFRVRNAAMLKR